MIALLDHPANVRERPKAVCFGSPKGMALEVRNNRIQEAVNRSRPLLEGAIGLGLSNPSASEERL
jgi:hypothetical protein